MPFNWKKRFHLSTFANAHYFQQLFKCELTQADKGFCRDCCCCFLFLYAPRLFFAFFSRQPPHTAYVYYQSILFRIFSINLYTYTVCPCKPGRYELYKRVVSERVCALTCVSYAGKGEIITCISLSAIFIYRKLWKRLSCTFLLLPPHSRVFSAFPFPHYPTVSHAASMAWHGAHE